MATQAEAGSNTGRSMPPVFPSDETLETRLARLEASLERLRETTPRSDKVTLLFFSGEQDKVLAGLMIAATAASLGMEVTAFFTFWGLNALKERRLYAGKGLKERMIDWMTPTGPGAMGVSQMNMLGAGAMMLKQMMKEKGVASAEELLALAREAGVKIVACSQTMQVMDIQQAELCSGIEIAGAPSYLVEAARSGCTLFI